MQNKDPFVDFDDYDGDMEIGDELVLGHLEGFELHSAEDRGLPSI